MSYEALALPYVKPEAGALSVALGVGAFKQRYWSLATRDNDPVKIYFQSEVHG